jgi:hypothetical protein
MYYMALNWAKWRGSSLVCVQFNIRLCRSSYIGRTGIETGVTHQGAAVQCHTTHCPIIFILFCFLLLSFVTIVSFPLLFLCSLYPFFLCFCISLASSLSLFSFIVVCHLSFCFLFWVFSFFLSHSFILSLNSSQTHIFLPFLTYYNFAIVTEQISSRDILLHGSIHNFLCISSNIHKALSE